MLPILNNWPHNPIDRINPLTGRPPDNMSPLAEKPDRTMLHISEMKCPVPPQRSCIVGKGQSMMEWKNVPDVDLFLTLNEATYFVDRQHFHCRGDCNKPPSGGLPGHRFCDWLPHWAVPVVPARCKDYYNYGYWFDWWDIDEPSICLTVIQAMRIAYRMGCRDIVMVGCDALFGDSQQYHKGVASHRNNILQIREQRDRVIQRPHDILSCCRDYRGVRLLPALMDWAESQI